MAAPQPHPWLEPLWVRLLVVALCLAALVAEYLYLGEPLWLMLWAAALIYAVWDLFLRGTYGRRAENGPGETPPAGDER